MCAARRVCCKPSKGARSLSPLGEPRRQQAYPGRRERQRVSDRGSGAAQAAEDGEGIARDGLPDELAARLDLAVDAGCERLGVLLRGGADDQVLPAALDGVALVLELVGERPCGRVRRAAATRTSHGA